MLPLISVTCVWMITYIADQIFNQSSKHIVTICKRWICSCFRYKVHVSQIIGRQKDRNALRFLWRDEKMKVIEDHITCVQVFGKIDSLYIANWKLKRTTRDNEELVSENIIDKINQNFHMGNSFTFKYRKIVNYCLNNYRSIIELWF